MGTQAQKKAPGKSGKAVKKGSAKTVRRSKKNVVKKTASAKGHAVNTTAKKSTARKGLSPKELEYFKKRLLSEKQRVLEEMDAIQTNNLKQSITDQTGELSHYSYHLGDTASLAYDREFSMGLAERQQKYLEQIDEALARIEDGTYGICKVTGEIIPRERLEEVPVAKYSVKGKEIVERQKRMMTQSQG